MLEETQTDRPLRFVEGPSCGVYFEKQAPAAIMVAGAQIPLYDQIDRQSVKPSIAAK